MNVAILQGHQNTPTRAIIALALIFGFINFGFTPSARAQGGFSLRSESEVKAQASLYDTAIREIGRISSMKLTTAKELELAVGILSKHGPNLRYNRFKMVAEGLNDSVFITAVRAKTGDSKSIEKFALELEKDPMSIFKLSGGQALGDRIRRSLEWDVSSIRRVANQLKQAATDVRAETGTHHAPGLASEHSLISFSIPELRAFDVAISVIAVAVIAVPPLALALYVISTTAVAVALWVKLVFAIPILLAKEPIEKIRDECLDEVDNRYRRCLRQAAEAGIFRIPAEASCYADWLLGTGACLLLIP